MEIPIQNIYYLLCYSWDRLEEQDIVDVDSTVFNNVWDLYAKVLVKGCHHLLKRGLGRNYVDTSEAIRGVKGKIDFGQSLKQNLFSKARAYCAFDELDYDALHNQVLKSTIHRLIRKDTPLDKKIKEELVTVYRKFDGISLVNINSRDFERVVVHGDKSFYDFLLKVCQTIHDHILITEQEGKYKFRSFFKDHRRMHKLFEHFVRNFYRREQSQYIVSTGQVKWYITESDLGSLKKLPRMQPDFQLSSRDRKIIVDTKYYVEAMNNRFSTQKIRTDHLYQMYAYVKNQGHLGGINSDCEGILLYPTVNEGFQALYQMGSHRILIQTVDLNRPWQNIHADLLALIN